jgi:hypothetical protein
MPILLADPEQSKSTPLFYQEKRYDSIEKECQDMKEIANTFNTLNQSSRQGFWLLLSLVVASPDHSPLKMT